MGTFTQGGTGESGVLTLEESLGWQVRSQVGPVRTFAALSILISLGTEERDAHPAEDVGFRGKTPGLQQVLRPDWANTHGAGSWGRGTGPTNGGSLPGLNQMLTVLTPLGRHRARLREGASTGSSAMSGASWPSPFPTFFFGREVECSAQPLRVMCKSN